jgi:hypothetical protein
VYQKSRPGSYHLLLVVDRWLPDSRFSNMVEVDLRGSGRNPEGGILSTDMVKQRSASDTNLTLLNESMNLMRELGV